MSVFELDALEVHYGDFRAVRDVSMTVERNEITAFIGPSGCGKTTVLRCLNRMNDVVPNARVGGTVRYHGVDLYAPEVSATEVRRDRKSTRLNSSHIPLSRMPSSA